VGEGLKEQTFEALRLCIEGFLNFKANELHPNFDLEHCRDQSFILLYRLLFIMFAEDRRLLPYKVNRLYTNNRSLGRHRDEIAARLDRVAARREDDYSRDSTALWEESPRPVRPCGQGPSRLRGASLQRWTVRCRSLCLACEK